MLLEVEADLERIPDAKLSVVVDSNDGSKEHVDVDRSNLQK
jgi:hypothetical protein